ncbi:Sporulation protein RMD1 [Hondaea fermentalgiana]|uniref:Sporulation protein RMD1 n=1 Tax=Hondaea fermentalgiana TaxID=2315210 RepID=A0A2R5GI86_9STRA|nr:Sporulation protein RMD1 [Hondaea fermentalgiana]|eukprot:GBG28373.1 Sporulation protein RMD1 [Hondaea fermentalgiana]
MTRSFSTALESYEAYTESGSSSGSSSSDSGQYPKRFVVPRAEGAGNVRAYYIAKKINVVPMFQKMYGRQRNWLEVDSLIVSFPHGRMPFAQAAAENDHGESSHRSRRHQRDDPDADDSGVPARGAPPAPPPPPSEPAPGSRAKLGLGPFGPKRTSEAKAKAEGDQSGSNVEVPAVKATFGKARNILSKSEGGHPCAVFFDYGAVVFFDCDEVLQTESITQAEQFCVGYLDTGGAAGADDFMVEVDPTQESWSTFKSNRLVVQKMDMNNIRVIASVLGQSVALGHFERVVDGMLQSFESANSEETLSAHSYTPSRTKLLYRMLSESNSVLSEVIVKLGVLDRTRMKEAWRFPKYGVIWEGLREEFEISDRFSVLEMKASYLQSNMRFLVELIHSHKGERLEWMIIVLITLELIVSVYGLFTGAPH